MTGDTRKKEDQELIDKACKAYGIDKKYVLGAVVDRKVRLAVTAVIVTHGGKKVKFSAGDKVTKLTHTEVTGEEEAEAKKTFFRRVADGLQEFRHRS
ncbi:MAG: hypothetical protein JXD19_07685 [Deltaproteobacteria bacterium]|nr:hypothetical protein [Deltaproteobacteria bacterium]